MEINSNEFLLRSHSTYTVIVLNFIKFRGDSDGVTDIKRKIPGIENCLIKFPQYTRGALDRASMLKLYPWYEISIKIKGIWS